MFLFYSKDTCIWKTPIVDLISVRESLKKLDSGYFEFTKKFVWLILSSTGLLVLYEERNILWTILKEVKEPFKQIYSKLLFQAIYIFSVIRFYLVLRWPARQTCLIDKSFTPVELYYADFCNLGPNKIQYLLWRSEFETI